MHNEWIDTDDEIIFEQGKDPNEGILRVTAHLEKILINKEKRDITFREVHQIVFDKGTSTFISKNIKETKKDGKTYSEEQFRIAGLTEEGRPLLVVLTPRDNGYAKRIVTAWGLSKDSPELKKLFEELPDLKEKYDKFKK